MKWLNKTLAAVLGTVLLGGAAAQGAWTSVDNLEALTLGDINGQNGWLTYSEQTDTVTNYAVVTFDPSGGGPATTNKVLQVHNVKQAYKEAKIPFLETGTVFFRVRTGVARGGSVGLSSITPIPATNANFAQIQSFLNYGNGGGLNVQTRNGTGGAVTVKSDWKSNTWYNIWFYVDNVANFTRFYVNKIHRQDAAPDNVLYSGTITNFTYRGGPVNADMVNFVVKSYWYSPPEQDFFVDDVYLDNSNDGTPNLTNPMPAVNETDTDGDGMPDWWEMQYFTNLTTANATSDYNGDGVTDLECYRADSSPLVTLPLFTSFTAANGYRTNLVQVAGGAGFKLNWSVLPSPIAKVSINQGVGDVTPLTVNGVGSITLTNANGNYTYTLTVSNTVTHTTSGGSVQVAVLPDGVGFIQITPNTGTMTRNRQLPSMPAGITASFGGMLRPGNAAGIGWGVAGGQNVPYSHAIVTNDNGGILWGFTTNTFYGWAPSGYCLWGSENNALYASTNTPPFTNTFDRFPDSWIQFSSPVILKSFQFRNSYWGGPIDNGRTNRIQGLTGCTPLWPTNGTVQWEFDAPCWPNGQGTGEPATVKTGAGIFVDTVTFECQWKAYNSFVIETNAGAADHPAITLSPPVKVGANYVTTWNSRPGWLYCIRRSTDLVGEKKPGGCVGSVWNDDVAHRLAGASNGALPGTSVTAPGFDSFNEVDLVVSGGTTTSYTNAIGGGAQFLQVIPVP